MEKRILSGYFKGFGFLRRIFRRRKNPFVFVAIGDSTVEGVGASSSDKSFAGLVFAYLKSNLGRVEFHNLGRSGAVIEEVVNEQLVCAVEKNPDLIILSVGANDIRKMSSAKKFERHFSKLAQVLRSQTSATIVINNIPDLSILSIFPKPVRIYCKWWVRRFNRRISRHANDMGAILVDVYSASRQLIGYEDLVAEDGIHPSDKGYQLWAQGIIDMLLQKGVLKF